jgi:hypothetical protein
MRDNSTSKNKEEGTNINKNKFIEVINSFESEKNLNFISSPKINLEKQKSENLININDPYLYDTDKSTEKGEVASKISNKSCDIKLKLRSILKYSIEYKDDFQLQCSIDKANKSKGSMWNRIKSKMSNIKNNIKYNTLTLNSFFDFYEFEFIKIFNRTYSSKTDLKRFVNDFYAIIYMSYRNDFEKIINLKNSKEYTSDCGWGCMIRSAQMMLARGFQMILGFKEKEYIKQILLLFADSPLQYDEFSDNEKFKQYFKKVVEDIGVLQYSDSDQVIDGNLCSNFQKSELTYSVPELFINEHDYKKIKSIVPPFSIRNICKLSEYYDKGPGEWFSDVIMSSIFQNLNNEFKPFEMIKILSFNEGVIYNQDLIKTCFELVDIKESNTLKSDETINPQIELNGALYKFQNPCIVFVSFRLGLDKINKDYHEYITKIFDIPNNLGIIGGNFNSAHYFIGVANENLLYIDPHLNQKAWNDMKGFEQSIETYLNKKIYKLQIKNMSPAFTVGFYFRNLKEYLDLTNYLNNIHNDNLNYKHSYSFIKFEENRKSLEEEEYDMIEDGDDF